MKKWFYKAGAGIAGVLFVASAMTLVAPKTVHAVVSALVTVANTSANPVPISNMEDPGRIAYEGFQAGIGSSGCSSSQCTFAFGQVPPNHRLVIENISGETFSVSPGVIAVRALNSSFIRLASFSEIPPSVGRFQAFNMPTHFYLDAGDSLTINVSTSGSIDISNSGSQTITVSGYLLDCSARPCNAIASF